MPPKQPIRQALFSTAAPPLPNLSTRQAGRHHSSSPPIAAPSSASLPVTDHHHTNSFTPLLHTQSAWHRRPRPSSQFPCSKFVQTVQYRCYR
ncbi:hypothetical protein SKAU_G00416080 [Synaphobranchus kaupii]|uniref:Uncharacterized protein n=1 Tax=Synaphobranchus kaupii TaxID=118154 RepID=A0A9Q1IAQ9_SYNKA|nr:hypothetical protein SKAU_G00416080 [Synaphobranchus kaupii]